MNFSVLLFVDGAGFFSNEKVGANQGDRRDAE